MDHLKELEDCFRAYGIGHVDSHVLAEALIHFGWRKTAVEQYGVKWGDGTGPDYRANAHEIVTAVPERTLYVRRATEWEAAK